MRLPSSLALRANSLAIFLGRIQEVDAVYINGREIGTTGQFQRTARDYTGAASAQISRVYAIPEETLTAHDPIILAVRIQSLFFAPGLAPGPFLLGDAHELTLLARQHDLPLWMRDSLWVSVLFMGFCVSFVSVYGAGRDDRNKWLPALLGCLAIASIPHTIIGYELGLSTPVIAWVSELIPIIPLGFLHISASINGKLTRIQWVTILPVYLVSLSALVFDISVGWFFLLSNVAGMLVIIAVAISLFQCVKAYRARSPVSVWTYGAVIILLLSIILYLSFGSLVSPVYDPLNIGLLLMVGGFLLAMAQQHRWDREALRQMTDDLLMAQENERERLAKELHDGVSQRLAVTRFRLERLAQNPARLSGEALQPPIEELRETGKDISTLVEALRPAALQEFEFSNALAHAADRWNAIGDAELGLHLDGDRQPPENKQTQLFRILQEAVHNSMRHGGASKIDISLTLKGNKGRHKIAVNGAGFDPALTTKGLGLTSMAERAPLIGAEFELVSAPGNGACILVGFDFK